MVSKNIQNLNSLNSPIIDGNIIPDVDAAYDIGIASYRFRNAYFEGQVNTGEVQASGNIIPDSDHTYDLGTDTDGFTHTYTYNIARPNNNEANPNFFIDFQAARNLIAQTLIFGQGTGAADVPIAGPLVFQGSHHNTEVNVVDPGQESIVTIPDPGIATAQFILSQGTQTVNGVKSMVAANNLGSGSSAPGAPSASVTNTGGAGAYNLVGQYTWEVTFLTASGETLASSASNSLQTVGMTTMECTVTIPTGNASVTGRNIYRVKGGFSTYYLLTTINDNTTTSYLDNINDSSLGSQNPPTSDSSENLTTVLGNLSLPNGNVTQLRYWAILANNSTQSVASNTVTTLLWGETIASSNSSIFGYSSGVFTPTKSGSYALTYTLVYPNNSSGTRQAWIEKNGSGSPRYGNVCQNAIGAAGIGNALCGMAVIRCNGTTDTIQVVAYQDSGSSLNVGGADGNTSQLTLAIELLHE